MRSLKVAQADLPITTKEVLNTIKVLLKYKTSGLDEPRAKLLQGSTHTLAKIVANNMSAISYSEAGFPECLTSSIIALLYNEGSIDRINNYSPIALVNVIARFVSGVYCNRIQPLLPSIISSAQAGLVPGRTIRKIIIVTHDVMPWGRNTVLRQCAIAYNL